jgi:hypothetical protein
MDCISMEMGGICIIVFGKNTTFADINFKKTVQL